MSERLATSAVLLSAALLTGCTTQGGHPAEAPTQIPTESASSNVSGLAAQYDSQLHLTDDDSETFVTEHLAATGLNERALHIDVSNRIGTIAIRKSADPASIALIPNNVSQSYSLQASRDPSKDETWSISLPDQGNLTSFLPIATVTENGGALSVMDQQPPLVRASPTENVLPVLEANVLAPTSKLLQQAFEHSAVKELHFVYSNQPDTTERSSGALSSYMENDGIEVIVLPKLKSITSSALIQAETHETGHSFFFKAPISELNTAVAQGDIAGRIRDACAELKQENFATIAPQLPRLIPLFKNVLTVPDDTDFNEVVTIDAAINKHNLINFQPTVSTNGQTANQVPECKVAGPLGMIDDVRVTKFHEPAISGDDRMVANSPQGAALENTFFDLYRTTPATKTMTEASYDGTKVDGHPEDGIDEMAASMFDIAINYPVAFKQRVEALTPTSKATVIQLFALIRNTYLQIDPTLANIIPDVFATH